MSSFSDEKIVLITASLNNINGFVLSKEFTTGNEPGRKVSIPIQSQNRHSIFSEKQYFAVLSEPLIFCCIFDTKSQCPTQYEIFSQQTSFVIPQNTQNFSLFRNIMVRFQKDQIQFYRQGTEYSLYSIKIPGIELFEMDSSTGEIYAFKEGTLIHFQFCSPINATGFDCLLFWLFYCLLEVKKDKEAADLLLQTPTPFERMVNLARNESDIFRFHLFKDYVYMIRHQYTLQRTAVAQFALELYIRIETSKEEPETDQFIQWINPLIEEGIILISTVEKLCKLYGWEEPLMNSLKQSDLFNVVMESNSIKEAEKILASIQSPEEFSKSALRIFNNCPMTIVNLISQRPDLIIGKMIPVLTSKIFMDKIIEFAKNHTLKDSWIRNLYSIQLSRTIEDKNDVLIDLIKNFCRRDSNSSKEDIDFLVRCLVDAKKFKMAAIGLFEREEYAYASGVSAHDPINGIDLIPSNISIEIRRRCALRILRSMDRKDAEKVAKKLLESTTGIDIITILEYLPNDTKIGGLRKVIQTYIDKNIQIAKEQKKKKEEALKGINESNEMVRVKQDQLFHMKRMQTCAKCGKLLLTDIGVVYPCGHALHKNCIKGFCSKDKNNGTCADCPMCGFSSIRMITRHFDPYPNSQYIDPWTVDEGELRKIFNR
ncbi:Pep3p [Histomonas meleagridis]|uniref:Pep3p n=1 Tax=Histomonas meleagridis TaxID=135588 RepID=UPI003559EA03|nr:Pep3p [Histomonas meleagridis]KAH0799500.1 Pep3p [Histomonas meleagridis]